MSAYMINNDTLDLLASSVEWGLHNDGLGLVLYHDIETNLPSGVYSQTYMENDTKFIVFRFSREHAGWIKAVLHHENIKSLVARYGDDPNDLKFQMHPYRRIDMDASENGYKTFFGAVRCYEYQACEHAGWRTSLAKALTDAIKEKMMGLFSSGKWEYNRPTYTPPVFQVLSRIEVPEPAHLGEPIIVNLDDGENEVTAKKPRGRPRKN